MRKGLTLVQRLSAFAVVAAISGILAPVQGTETPRKVILIGDSIRIGYQDTVKEELKQVAEVVFPKDNCRHSQNIIDNHLQWIVKEKPDIVHINAGLHELYMNPQGKKQIEVGDYARNLRKIFDTLRKNNIEIIWATTTPVIDEWYTKQIGYPARRNEDVIAYNKAAAEIVREYSIPVDDLYSFVHNYPHMEELYSNDGVHHNPQGCHALGKSVATCIREHMKL